VSEQTKQAHTPGPWTAKLGYTPTVWAGETCLCAVSSHADELGGRHLSELTANARLIAAAPALLTELRDTAAWLDERAGVLVQLLADPAGWGRGQAATDKRQAIRDEIARLQGRAFLIRQVIQTATQGN
jgi:hypothetical protein